MNQGKGSSWFFEAR